MSDTVEIYLNSKSANQKLNDEVADCFYHLPNIDANPLTEDVYVSVRSAVIPFSWYNINNINNKLVIIYDSVTYTLTIPNGNYNVNTLRNEVATLINATHGGDGHDITITYITKTNKFLFTSSHHAFTLKSTSTCFEVLGFKDNNDYTSSDINGTNTLESIIAVNLFVVRTLYVASNNFILNNVNSATPQDSSILASIPVIGNPASIIHYSNNNAKHKIHHLNNFNNLHIKIIDNDGDLVFFNDVNYSMTLELTIIKK
jgi:hypothetical protein